MNGQGHNSAAYGQELRFAEALERLLNCSGTTREKLLAAIRIRHTFDGGLGRLTAQNQMALASISEQTYKRISSRADELIRLIGFDAYFNLPKLGRADRGRHVKVEIPQSMRWQVFRRDGYACVKCGSLEDLTADHIVPEIEDGETSLENIQTLCRPCNSRKGAK